MRPFLLTISWLALGYFTVMLGLKGYIVLFDPTIRLPEGLPHEGLVFFFAVGILGKLQRDKRAQQPTRSTTETH